MISFLVGKLIEKSHHRAVVLTSGGVGYQVTVQWKQPEPNVGGDISLYTFLKVSDQALDLYGFATVLERDFFILLMTVSGVGPKTAMNILSLGAITDMQSAIGRGDVKYLTAVAGLGKKTAERLVVELKNKIGEQIGIQSETGNANIAAEVIEALVGMGYDQVQAKDIVLGIDATGKTTEQLLRMALQHMR